MGSIQKQQQDKRKFKGHMPLYADQLLFWALRTIFQIPIFILFYNFFISPVNINNTFGERVTEIGFIFVFLIVSDMIAYIIGKGIAKYIVQNEWGYLFRAKNRKFFLAFITDYFIYIALRTLAYAFGLITIITSWLYWHLPVGINGYSFLFAWILVSLGSKALAMVLSYKIVL